LVCCLWFVVGGLWLVERRRPPALATLRFSVSPPLRLRRLPKSSSLPSIDSSAPPTTGPPPQRHERHLNPSTTKPPRLAGSPSPLPVLLPLEKGRRNERLSSGERFRIPTSPRLAVSPAPQVTTSSFPPFIDSPALPPTGPPSHATSTTPPRHHQTSLYLRLPVSPAPRPAVPSLHRFIGTTHNQAASPTPRAPTRAQQYLTTPSPRLPVSPAPRPAVPSPHRLIGENHNEAAFPRREHILNSSTAPNLPIPQSAPKVRRGIGLRRIGGGDAPGG
jgi:hypothetical protein